MTTTTPAAPTAEATDRRDLLRRYRELLLRSSHEDRHKLYALAHVLGRPERIEQDRRVVERLAAGRDIERRYSRAKGRLRDAAEAARQARSEHNELVNELRTRFYHAVRERDRWGRELQAVIEPKRALDRLREAHQDLLGGA